MDDMTIWLLVAPILVVQLALIIRNLIHVSKKNETKYLNKIAWIIVILMGNLLGNICYLLLEGDNDDSN